MKMNGFMGTGKVDVSFVMLNLKLTVLVIWYILLEIIVFAHLHFYLFHIFIIINSSN